MKVTDTFVGESSFAAYDNVQGWTECRVGESSFAAYDNVQGWTECRVGESSFAAYDHAGSNCRWMHVATGSGSH